MIHFSAAFGADHFGFFHDATDLDFAQKLRKLDLQIETIANGHGWIGTMAETPQCPWNPQFHSDLRGKTNRELDIEYRA